MSISIFVITHIPFDPPIDPVYIPLQVGHCDHADYGYLADDTGENISDKNQYYSELTGLYWIWKNYCCADHVGICHYRRYFLNNQGTLMAESDFMNILSKYDVIVSQPVHGAYDYQTVYSRSHDIHNLEMTGEIIMELCPEYYTTFQEVLTDKYCYTGNLFVAPRTLFDAYCEWLFSIFSTLEDRIDVTGYDDYHKRVFGFLSEQLLIVWIRHNHLSFYEAPFGLTQEKAETILLKQNIQNFLSQNDIHGAYHHLCNTLDKRPDLLLEASDFNKELTAMEHLLNICRIEEEAQLPTILQFSQDLGILSKHFRLLVNILDRIQQNTVTKDELQYLIDCRVSYKALIYIMQNCKRLTAHPLMLLNQLAVIYTDAQDFLTALCFLEEALSIHDTDATTLSNIIAVLQNMGQQDMAEEYSQLLNSLTSKRIMLATNQTVPVLAYIAEQYASALESLGCTVFRYDIQDFAHSYESLLAFQKFGLDASIVFNNVGFRMEIQAGKSLWDIWNIPCYNIIVDHPMHYFDTLDHAPANGIVICADRNHMDYIKRFYPAVRKTAFLPTAGECLKPYSELKPFAERSIEVLFIGAYKYTEESPDEVSMQLNAGSIQSPSKTFENIADDYLRSRHRVLSETELKAFIQKYRHVDVNICSVFRLKILETLLKAGIRVTVYGSRWEFTNLCSYPNFIYKGDCSVEDGIRLMEDSRIVLNQLANFKAGASERIFEAMLQGAIALTDDSLYLKENFSDSVDIKFYSPEHLESLPDLVRSILTDPASAEMIRQNAYKKACAEHTWLHRASMLLRDL